MRKQIIISRVLVICLMIVSAMGANAQSSYRNAIKEYIAITRQYSIEKMRSILMAQNGNFFLSASNIPQLTSRYCDEQYLEDMTDLLEIVFSDEVTESELKNVISLMSTPKGKSLTQHSLAWSDKFEKDIVSYIQTPLSEIQAGRRPSPAEPNGNISAKYALKFTEFMNNTGGVEQFMNAFSQVSTDDGPFREWIEDNVTILAMNSAYDLITLQDLDYSSQLYANESYRNVMNAAMSLASDLMTVGSFVMIKYMSWMREHGAEMSDMGEQALQYYLNYLESQAE